MDKLAQLSLQDMQFLLEIRKTGGIVRAGERFGWSPSAASRAVNRIRSLLGNACFVKGQEGLTATDYFDSVEEHLRTILKTAQLLKQPDDFNPAECTTMFRISCAMAEVGHIVGGVLPQLIKQAPLAGLEVSYHGGEFSGLFSKTFHFAIVTAVELPPNVHFLNLYPTDRVVLVRKGHPLTRLQRPLRNEDLQKFDRISGKIDRMTGWTGPDQGLFPNERYRGHTKLLTTRLNVWWEALEQTDLISILGWRAAEIAMRANNLTVLALPPEHRSFNPMCQLIWTDYTHNNPACVWLRGLFADWRDREAKRIAQLMKKQKGPPGYDE